MKNFKSKLMAWVLMFALVFCTMPVVSFADENEGGAETVTSQDVSASQDNQQETSGENIDEVTTPGENTDEVTAPGENTDEVTTPGENTDEVTTPGENTDEVTTSGENTDEVTTPGENTDEVTTPGENTDEVTTPGENTDEVTTPGENTDEVTTPGENTDEVITSGENIDEVTTPEVTTPEVTTPEVTTPGIVEAPVLTETAKPMETILETVVIPQVVVSEQVTAFLAAAAELPETVTKENLEEVVVMLENLLPLFGQLTEEEQESDEVSGAYMLALALWEQVEGVRASLLNETAVTSLEELAQALADSEQAVVTLGADITGNIIISRDMTLDLGGYTLTGDGKGSVITVTGGEVTIQNGTVTGGKVIEDNGGGIYVKSGAVVTLGTAGVVKGNVAEHAYKRATACGGGVYVAKGGTFILNGGSVVENRAGDPNYYDDRQEPSASGGGIQVAGGATFKMFSGEVSRNSAVKKGGGICLGVDGNVGVDVEITGGTISGNTATTGGGIYVSNSTELTLQKAAVTGNVHQGRGFGGGGIWFCGLGSGVLYATRGAYISGNASERRGDDFSSEIGSRKAHSFPTRLYDGTPLIWYPDGASGEWDGGRYNAATLAIEDFGKFFGDWFGPANRWGDAMAMHTETAGSADDSYYTIQIKDNIALSEGAGIACNGFLIMGEDSDIALTVKKEWAVEAGTVLPEAITVNVLNNGKVIDTVTLNEENGWQKKLVDLPSDGNYTVEEAAVEGYDVSYSQVEPAAGADNEFVITITNAPKPKTTSMTVSKVWSDGAEKHVDGEITVNVLDAAGNLFDTVKLNAANNWFAKIEGLKIDEKYTVEEVEVEGYTTAIEYDDAGNAVITNTLKPDIPKPETTSMNVTKIWADGADKHVDGEITVNVLDGNGNVFNTVKLNAANNWFAKIEGLKIDEKYTVEEVAVEGYTTAIEYVDGNAIITNTPETTEVTSLTVRKVWSDGAVGHENDSVTVDVLDAANTVVATVVLNAVGNWTAIVDNLDIDQTYHVAERPVAGYTATIVTNEDGSITITNTVNSPDNPGDDGGNDDYDEPDTTPIADNQIPTTGEAEETTAIDDGETPMSELPEDEEEEIFDEDVPMSDVPKTGDSLLLWFFAAAASGLAALAAGRKRK